jgi:hypothetical protein
MNEDVLYSVVKNKKEYYLMALLFFSLYLPILFLLYLDPSNLSIYSILISASPFSIGFGLLSLRGAKGETSIRIYRSGFYVMSGFLNSKELYIKYQDIKAIYPNEYSYLLRPIEYIVIIKRSDNIIFIRKKYLGDDGLKMIKDLIKERSDLIKEVPNYISSTTGEIYPTPDIIEFNDNNVIFKGQKYDITLQWNDIQKIKGTSPLSTIIKKDKEKISFWGFHENVMKHRKIENNIKNRIKSFKESNN